METTPQQHKGMLPGMAAIALFLLLVSMLAAFQLLSPKQGSPPERYAFLAVCTLTIVGIFGMLKLRRWGWSIVTGVLLVSALANFYAFIHTHLGMYLIQGLFSLLFFLYLARPEVRERVH